MALMIDPDKAAHEAAVGELDRFRRGIARMRGARFPVTLRARDPMYPEYFYLPLKMVERVLPNGAYQEVGPWMLHRISKRKWSIGPWSDNFQGFAGAQVWFTRLHDNTFQFTSYPDYQEQTKITRFEAALRRAKKLIVPLDAAGRLSGQGN